MKLDLHTHTNYSDGENTVKENVVRAKELGLDGIAITDHDNISSWDDIDKINDYIIIKGVELSTYYNNCSVHVLGYYLNDNNDYSELKDFLIDMREKRIIRLKKMIELLKQFDIELTEEEILNEADGAVGRVHVAKAIIKKYPERNYTIKEIFDKYIDNGRPAFVQTSKLTTQDAINLLKRNNCLVVIAHPLLIEKADYKEILKLNIDGVECFYPYENKDYNEVIEIAKNNNLMITGGSDYHGKNVRNTMGKAYLTTPYTEEFLKRINKG